MSTGSENGCLFNLSLASSQTSIFFCCNQDFRQMTSLYTVKNYFQGLHGFVVYNRLRETPKRTKFSKQFVQNFIVTLLQCSVPKGDLHCQCILSIFPARVYQFYVNILVFININLFFILTTNLHCTLLR